MTNSAAGTRSYNIGIIFNDENGKGLTHPYFSPLVNSFKNEAEINGNDVTFINHDFGIKGMSFLEHCRFRKLDGVCLVCIDFSLDEIKELAKSGFPCVTIDHLFKHVPAVLSDNENGIDMLVNYAVSLGHRRIAFIHGHNNSLVTKTRISQFKTALDFHGLPFPDEYLQSGLYSDIELTREIVLRLLRLPERPTCILLPDDYCYLGAQDAAKEAGLRIPEDISFAGYDGIDLTQRLRPALTTIHQDSDFIGRESARRLIKSIENPGSFAGVTVHPGRLIEGGTISKI